MHIIIEGALYHKNSNISDNKVNIITTFTFLSLNLSGVTGGFVAGKVIDKLKWSLIKCAIILIDIS